MNGNNYCMDGEVAVVKQVIAVLLCCRVVVVDVLCGGGATSF
jgi:hypothetical protein